MRLRRKNGFLIKNVYFENYLTDFKPLFPFYTPLKYHITPELFPGVYREGTEACSRLLTEVRQGLFVFMSWQKQPPKVFFEKMCSQENTCATIPFSIKLSKKRFWHRCFPVNFAKFLRTPFLTEHPRWLLLKLQRIKISHIKFWF